MSDKSRMPRAIDPFNSYFIKTTSYWDEGTPTTNATRLGISAEEVTTWKGFLAEWQPLYLQYSDKENYRTKTVLERLYDIISRVIAFDQTNHILDRVAVSLNVTITDLVTFNIHKGVMQSDRTTTDKPMTDTVIPVIRALGGGMMEIKCYSPAGGSRPGIPSDGDAVMYYYQLGGTAPDSTDSPGLTMVVSSKASFTLSLGNSAKGKVLYLYFCWYNTRHPELTGPVCELQSPIVL